MSVPRIVRAGSHRATRIPTLWWRGEDSNLRRRSPADLQSAPVGHLGTSPCCAVVACRSITSRTGPTPATRCSRPGRRRVRQLASADRGRQFRRNGGADGQIRTGDLLITNQLLYQLSYIGIHSQADGRRRCLTRSYSSITGTVVPPQDHETRDTAWPPRALSPPRRVDEPLPRCTSAHAEQCQISMP
jgi:hypothetical protein